MTDEKTGGGGAPIEESERPTGGEATGAGKAGDSGARLQRAFEAGDYRLLRELGREVERTGKEEERQAARELTHRTLVDPAMVIALLACAALFFGIAYVYVLR
jgi:hypothetical protein